MRIAQDVFATTGGRDFDPSQPVVIFLHGAGMDQSVWALLSRWFAHHGHSALAVDFPGHGRSGGALLPSIGAMADWVAQLIDGLGLAQASLIGHSMGSLVALETAARHPAKIRALGLLGTAPTMPVHPDMLAAAKINSPDAIAMVSLWGHGAHATMGGSATPGLWMLGAAVRLLEKARPGLIYNDLAACNAYQDGLAAAAKIACPVTIVVGEKDVMTPLKAVKLLTATLTQARVTVLKGAGHMLMAERPDAVLEALKGLE
jgi:pimeloyl-ACP methyl ester carboxylesterase